MVGTQRVLLALISLHFIAVTWLRIRSVFDKFGRENIRLDSTVDPQCRVPSEIIELHSDSWMDNRLTLLASAFRFTSVPTLWQGLQPSVSTLPLHFRNRKTCVFILKRIR